MAIYPHGPLLGVQATVANVNTAVIAGAWSSTLTATTTASFPDNCHTVIIHNTHAANTLLVGSELAEIGAATLTNPARVPPGGTLTVAIGVHSERMPQISNPGAGVTSGFVYDATGAGTVADITYVCGILAGD